MIDNTPAPTSAEIESVLERQVCDRLRAHKVIYIAMADRKRAAFRLEQRGVVETVEGGGRDAGLLIGRRGRNWVGLQDAFVFPPRDGGVA